MPIYEYECAGCGQRFEKLVKVSAPLPECPTCAKVDGVRKLVSAAAFVLKGGGWYKDHYGLKKPSGGESSGSSSSGGSESAGGTGAASGGAGSTGGTSGTGGSGGGTPSGTSSPASG